MGFAGGSGLTVSVVAFIFLVVFFLVLVLIWGILLFVYVREKSITPAKEFFLKTFMSTLSIIGAILAATVATSVQINKLMVDFNATFNADQSQTTNVSVIGNLGDISPEDKLRQAEIAFDAEEYQTMLNIYSYGDTESSAIRNNNYGYAYANGLYVEPNLEIAELYFDKAIALEFEPGYANKFRAIMCQRDFERAATLLVEWNSLPNHTILQEYFEVNVTNIVGITLEDFCQNFSTQEQIEVLQNLKVDEYLGYTVEYSAISNTVIGGYYHTYELTSTDTYLNTNYQTITEYIYKHYKSDIVGGDLLNIYARC